MATDIQTTAPAAPTLDDLRYRLSIAQYERIARAEIIKENEPVYLWKGQLVTKMTKGHPHYTAMANLNMLLVRLLPDGWYVSPEQPIALGDDSMPEPDLAVLRGAPNDYSRRYPTANDAALLVEIADSSLPIDQGETLEGYAEAGIPVYWIVNLPQRRVDVYTNPTGPVSDRPACFEVHHAYGPEREVPVVLDRREVGRLQVKDILPALEPPAS